MLGCPASVTKLAATATIVVLGIAVASSGADVSASALGSAACAPATSIEAIVDDSGSMGDADPDNLRVTALDILIDAPANASLTLGALEFGSTASTLFKPQTIGSSAGAMKAVLADRIDYADLFTNYNAAFSLAKTENPGAGARIFLTDGGHDVGAYLKGHRGGPPTYVLGIGIGAPGTDSNANQLQQIATDTGGTYYTAVTSASLPGVMNDIQAKLSCTGAPARS
jgi:hypothetical protein